MSEIQQAQGMRKGESSADAGPNRVIVWEVKQWGVSCWAFAVVFAGKRREFVGVPNRCFSAREARARAGWRLKWLREGTFNDHYGPPMPWPGSAPVQP